MQVLPIGSVVLLKNHDHRTIITGRKLRCNETKELYDYAGCPFPDGYQDASSVILFNKSEIKIVFAIGYQSFEEFELKRSIEKEQSQ